VANQYGCTILQYIDDLLLAGPTQEVCMEGNHLILSFSRRQDIRFPKTKPRFTRILSNTLGFPYHKDNVDWPLRGNKPSVPFQLPRPTDRLENFYGSMDFRFLLDLDPQLISLGKTPL
jgi:hypothetical protein